MKITKSCERILPRVSADYVQKWFFLWKWIPTFLHILPRVSAHYIRILAYFTSNICSLRRHFCIFYLEYLLITMDFFITWTLATTDENRKLISTIARFIWHVSLIFQFSMFPNFSMNKNASAIESLCWVERAHTILDCGYWRVEFI